MTSIPLGTYDFLVTLGGNTGLRVKVKTVTRIRGQHNNFHRPLSDDYDVLALVHEETVATHMRSDLPRNPLALRSSFSLDDIALIVATGDNVIAALKGRSD